MRSGERKGNAGKAAKRKRQMLKVPRTKPSGGKVHREKERETRMHCNITWESYYERKCKDLRRRKLKQVVNYSYYIMILNLFKFLLYQVFDNFVILNHYSILMLHSNFNLHSLWLICFSSFTFTFESLTKNILRRSRKINRFLSPIVHSIFANTLNTYIHTIYTYIYYMYIAA